MDNKTVESCNRNKNNKDIAWKAGTKMAMDGINPLFKNLKQEVLNNEFSSITKRSWNETLRKCQAFYEVIFFERKYMNHFNLKRSRESLK